MKKLLIITASLGNGHNTVANFLKNQEPNEYNIKLLDITKFNIIGKIMKFCYFYFSEKTLKKIFYKTNTKKPSIFDKFFYNFFFKSLNINIKSYKPDKILCTFPCFSICVPKEYISKTNIYVTDYFTPHLSWTWGNFNKIFVNDKESKFYLSSYIEKDKIVVHDYPIKKPNKKWSFKNTKKILVFFHSVLIGNEIEIIKKIQKKYPEHKLLILTGNNFDFFSKRLKKVENIKLLKWQENINNLYFSVDKVAGKCGGAFITEVINIEIPVIITHVFSGQEKGNYKYLKKYYSYLIKTL
jgi:processive 1,2-diacylglycerol beta-glucosyltransferase